MNNKQKPQKGITLIALVITIIVLLILAGISIGMLSGDNGILNQATDARKQAIIAAKKEEVHMAILKELSRNHGDDSKVKISKVVEEIRGYYSSQSEKNAIIGEKTGEEEDRFPGKITYNKAVSKIGEAIIIEVDENLDIKANTGADEGDIVIPDQNDTGSTSEYTKIGNVYCNSPDLSGFNPSCTYYVTYDNTGAQTGESIPISQPAPTGWYDYSSDAKKWANIVTNNNGNKTYWVWIPRFKYITDSSSKTTTARFVDMSDKCYLDVNDVKTEIDVSSYDISDAFTFNGKQLAGYWVSKYRVQEGTDNGTAGASQDSTDQIEVDLSGFNPANTYYVTYDENGNQTSEDTPISQNPPEGWYDYSKKKWANVMTNNNGLKTYWTYIPRYKYQVWKELQQTYVRYIRTNITDSNVEEEYTIPDSFTFGGQQLKGYWVSKYRIQDSPADSSVFNGTYYK